MRRILTLLIGLVLACAAFAQNVNTAKIRNQIEKRRTLRTVMDSSAAVSHATL